METTIDWEDLEMLSSYDIKENQNKAPKYFLGSGKMYCFDIANSAWLDNARRQGESKILLCIFD